MRPMPYKLRMVVITSQRHWRYTWYRDPPGYREEGDHSKPCGLDTRQSFKGGCDGILKVDIVDIGQKTN